MKFISFKHNKQNKFGIINNNKITDLTGKVSNSNTLKDLIQNRGIQEAKSYATNNPGNIHDSDIEYLPLIPNPGKIICVGLNYSEHVKETNRTVEENPVIFSSISRKSNCTLTTNSKTRCFKKFRFLR